MKNAILNNFRSYCIFHEMHVLGQLTIFSFKAVLSQGFFKSSHTHKIKCANIFAE